MRKRKIDTQIAVKVFKRKYNVNIIIEVNLSVAKVTSRSPPAFLNLVLSPLSCLFHCCFSWPSAADESLLFITWRCSDLIERSERPHVSPGPCSSKQEPWCTNAKIPHYVKPLSASWKHSPSQDTYQMSCSLPLWPFSVSS